ncbi:VOC family protein [Brachybacterium subflavum]|uniref:VOC family protein n=1 Tax=Brachybacterium subflavum TaxID=2585206 RepID=UPI00187AE75B|nr:VOC family protein [Brachybacterium subflavum]
MTLADAHGHQLSLMTRDATVTENPACTIFVDGIEAAHTAAIAAGVEIVHPLTREDWGVTRFFYRDSAGSVVNVGTHTG